MPQEHTDAEFETLDAAIDATVRHLVDMATARDRGLKERIIQQGVKAFKELVATAQNAVRAEFR